MFWSWLFSAWEIQHQDIRNMTGVIVQIKHQIMFGIKHFSKSTFKFNHVSNFDNMTIKIRHFPDFENFVRTLLL